MGAERAAARGGRLEVLYVWHVPPVAYSASVGLPAASELLEDEVWALLDDWVHDDPASPRETIDLVIVSGDPTLALRQAGDPRST